VRHRRRRPAPDAKPAGADAKPAAPDAKTALRRECRRGASAAARRACGAEHPDGRKTLHYTVTVGTLPVRDSKGALSGEVVYTAYTMEGKDRPVTFAFNGGPGAASCI
jgi:carboxypeptidase C (cathepsin A)